MGSFVIGKPLQYSQAGQQICIKLFDNFTKINTT
jgi:hypothetical protein